MHWYGLKKQFVSLNCSKDLKRVRERERERTIEKVVRENGVTLPRLISGQPGCRISAKDVHIQIFEVLFWIFRMADRVMFFFFLPFLTSGRCRCMCLWIPSISLHSNRFLSFFWADTFYSSSRDEYLQIEITFSFQHSRSCWMQLEFHLMISGIPHNTFNSR